MKTLPIFFLCLICPGLAQAQALYKWVDDKGVTHYTKTPPPEASKIDREVLNKRGRTVGKIRGELTEEERVEQEKLKAEQAAQQKQAKKDKKRDRALLATYKSVDEINEARDEKLEFLKEQVAAVTVEYEDSSAQYDKLVKEAVGIERSGKSVSEDLKARIRSAKRERDDHKAHLDRVEHEMKNNDKHFADDVKRFKELKGIKD